jgi:solute carrier family 31 (copper transporter), member 1
MQNGFQTADGKDNCILFLFRGWNIDSTVKYVFMLIGVICMGLLNGSLAYVRHRLMDNARHRSSLLIHQIWLSLLYGIQMILAYWMMLLVMTYETGVFIALILGLVIGYFIFGYIEAKHRPLANEIATINDSTYQNQFSSTPCCQTSS